MKLVMDEKLKHRLIGLAVILSLGAIFAPAVLRKSNQTLDEINVRVALPPKPAAPKVILSNEHDLFKTLKIAKVDISEVPVSEHTLEVLKAKPIELDTPTKESTKLTQTEPEIVSKTIKPIENSKNKVNTRLAKSLPRTPAQAKPKPMITPPIRKTKLEIPPPRKEAYAVQLASFAKLANAQSLMSRLKAKGYSSKLAKITTKEGIVYKVSVGHASNKNDALHLKNQLANSMQLNGFVVNVEVS